MRLSSLRLLGACLALAAAVACGSRDEARRPEVRSDAAAAPRDPAPCESAAFTGSGARIVVLGDSLTAGLGLATDEAYPAVLQEYLTRKG